VGTIGDILEFVFHPATVLFIPIVRDSCQIQKYVLLANISQKRATRRLKNKNKIRD
jgi:hypothetical protein